MSITEQIVTNKKGKAVAVQIPLNQYKKLLELAEEMEDIKAYDKAMKRKHDFIPFDQAIKELEGQTKKVMYQLVIDRYAQKQLAKISPPYFNRIVKAINDLATNPRPQGYKKLTARPGYRIRIGDYRIIYNVEDKILTVFVIEIGHRKDIYD